MARTIDYLRELASGPLPREVSEASNIDTVRLLRGVGWVVADPCTQAGTRVHDLTFAGRAVLAKVSELQQTLRDGGERA